MAISTAGAETRQPQRGLPRPQKRISDFPQLAHEWIRAYTKQQPAESASNHCHGGDGIVPYHSAIGFGGLLEHPTATILTCVYIVIALAVCLLYDLNFVYIFLVITSIVLATIRWITFSELPRDPWLIWFMLTDLAKATAFFLAFTLIFQPEWATVLRPYLRLTWLVVFVLNTVGTGDKSSELAHYLHVKKRIFESKSDGTST